MKAIRTYESGLIGPLLDGLGTLPGCTIFGITDPARYEERVPTVAFRLAGHHPRQISQHLAGRAISAWDGDYYAVELVRRLGFEADGGMLRIGLVHYNTIEEIDRLIAALRELTDVA